MNAPILVIYGVSKIIFCRLMGTSWQMGEVSAGLLTSLVDLAVGLVFLPGAKATQADRWSVSPLSRIAPTLTSHVFPAA